MILIYIMSDTEQEIDFDESNMNNGQIDLESYLDTLDPYHTTSLEIESVLYGDLDFSILKDKGFIHVNSIIFLENGGVTELRNIPEGVHYLECTHQQLEHLENLPESIKELKINNNKLKKFSAKGYVNLNVLNIYDNELSVLSDLPSSLETLLAQNNALKKLSLKEAQSLKQINVSNNPLLILEHVPNSLEQIEMENNPFTEVVREGDPKKGKQDRVEFLDALYIYFKLKNAYDKKLLQKKRNAFHRGNSKKEGRKFAQQVKEHCVYCKRNVGTHFFTKDDTFYAVCGDKRQPCELDIQIFRGEYFPLQDLMDLEKDEIEKKKEDIILLKMDSLFKYVGEADTGMKFKKTLEEFNEERNLHKETLEKYDKVYNNLQRDHEINKKQEKVYEIQQQIQLLLDEFQEKENREILIAAMDMLKTDLLPALQNLRLMRYETMYVEEKMDKKKSYYNESILVQEQISVQHKSMLIGKEPKVVKFHYQKRTPKPSQPEQRNRPEEKEEEEEEENRNCPADGVDLPRTLNKNTKGDFCKKKGEPHKKLLLKLHPDKNSECTDLAHDKFIQITELCDSIK